MIKNSRFLISKPNDTFSTSFITTYCFPYSTSSTSLKQELNIDNNVIDLEAVNWFTLSKNGKIIVPFMGKKPRKKAAVYIYQNILDKDKIYIGSSANVARRLIQHKYSFNKNIKNCPKFYNCVNKYGWNNFRVGILEYLNLSNVNTGVISKALLKKSLLEREQFYLDVINPTLNINKIAGSTLGFKHSEETRLVMGLQRRGKSINWLIQDLSYIVSEEMINKLSLRARHGVIVKVLDKDNIIINTFPTIVSAAKFYNLDHNTISKYIKNGSSYKDLRFLAEFKYVRVWVFDKECKIVDVFSNAQKAAKFCNTNHTTLRRYLKSGKLWKNKYYFSHEAKLKY
jgi:group I intron endonuclease